MRNGLVGWGPTSDRACSKFSSRHVTWRIDMATPSNELFGCHYLLRDPFGTRALRLTTADGPSARTREYTYLLLKGGRVDTPVRLVTKMGSQAMDVLWSDWIAIVVVSSRLVGVLRAIGATGWSTYPVDASDRNGAPLDGYAGLAITGRVGALDRTRSEIIQKPAPTPTGTAYAMLKGLYFDEGTWDGSDIFLVEDTLYIVVSERVKRALERARITNVRFTRLTDVELHPE